MQSGRPTLAASLFLRHKSIAILKHCHPERSAAETKACPEPAEGDLRLLFSVGRTQSHSIGSGRQDRRISRCKLTRAASRAGARFTAAHSHAVFQNPKTGMR